jgi:2-dehydro-3-deoxyphosphogluconate aldolase/(4S)-4-hydroxy-2-oxoglutarate aldolase
VTAKDRMAVLAAIMNQSIIPVFHDPDVEVCRNVIRACVNGGARCIEFVDRADSAAHVFREITCHFASGDHGVILGVGSIVDAPTAAMYIASGAHFVIGPLLNAEVARLCNRRGILYGPGCGSATEIGNAQELGCEIVKLFPGSSVGGPEFVRSVLAPMPWTRIVATGGVEPSEDSLRRWFGAGIVACGIGSRLITDELLQARDYGGIERRVRVTIELAARIKHELGR